jgi:hypothetical protein
MGRDAAADVDDGEGKGKKACKLGNVNKNNNNKSHGNRKPAYCHPTTVFRIYRLCLLLITFVRHFE